MNKKVIVKYIILILFLLILYEGYNYATKHNKSLSDFIYPIKRVYYIASSFGEFRENHFHAGIDFTTRMRTGEPVYAVNDGEIFRIRYQFRGYGKVLYIRHRRNIISVYAHLDRFENSKLRLEDLLSEYQKKEKKKYVDIYLDTGCIPVKKGQLIAYSGETGEGLPHLHFEFRKGEDTPINPFDSFYKELRDRFPPKIQGFILCSDSFDSYINGRQDCQLLSLYKKKDLYVADKEVLIEGRFKLYVSIYESIYWRAPFLVKFYIDNRLVFEVKNSFFSYSDNRYFGFLWDQGQHGYENFYIPIELCNPNADKLSVVKYFDKKLCNFNLDEGKHILKVEAFDTSKNRGVGELYVNVRGHKELFLSEEVGKGKICVNFDYRDKQEKLFRQFSLDSLKIQYWDFINSKFQDFKDKVDNDECGLKFSVPISTEVIICV